MADDKHDCTKLAAAKKQRVLEDYDRGMRNLRHSAERELDLSETPAEARRRILELVAQQAIDEHDDPLVYLLEVTAIIARKLGVSQEILHKRLDEARAQWS